MTIYKGKVASTGEHRMIIKETDEPIFMYIVPISVTKFQQLDTHAVGCKCQFFDGDHHNLDQSSCHVKIFIERFHQRVR